ncbi:MAG: alpha/beta hydrolase [Candidatus Omnitrophica bacterium]|nr:alpha/beta hydrolase [Candidatus Omnitrophota bacterium]
MPKVKLNDISLYYEVYGKGAPLLLIGGLGSDSSSWLGVVKKLSSHFKTIIFDNRGTGRSSAMKKPHTIHHMAEDAVRLLDYLKIKQAHVIGHSMGGYIAQELAMSYPERVAKLVLVSTATVSSKKNNVLFKDIYTQLKRQGYCREWFERWVPLLFSKKIINDSNFIETFIKNSIEYPYLQKADGFKSQIDAIASFDARAKIGTIKAKTLILEGRDDILITPQEAGALAKRIHKSVFKLLDGVAHSIHIENPKLFTSAVMDFLKSKKLEKI